NAGALLTNAGAFHNNAGALLTNAGAFHNNAGALLTNAGAFHNNAGALLTNTGALLTNAGVLRIRSATMPMLTLGAFAPHRSTAFRTRHDSTHGATSAMRAP
ncbi:MAG: hypothetical protein WCP31_00505, partial [Chloroflexales bacterium]